MEDLTLKQYLEDGIRHLSQDIIKATVKNPQTSLAMARFAKGRRAAEARREAYQIQGTHVPPFLIASITSRCNLHCTGCYARAEGACVDGSEEQGMDAPLWNRIFEEARDLGCSFILLAGGEPFLRPDVLEAAATHPEILFPIFTNGTLLTDKALDFLKKHRNLIPILSVEGDATLTDTRRGAGMYQRLMNSMTTLHQQGLLYGTSVTVTRENQAVVTSRDFLDTLTERGCRVVFFVEYVPICKGTGGLAPTPADRTRLMAALHGLRDHYDDCIFIAFPGDEARSGGCLAAGRGFFHINPKGDAEPCPFSPYSDTNLRQASLLEALHSKLFTQLQSQGTLTQDHDGGCVLFAEENQVKALLEA